MSEKENGITSAPVFRWLCWLVAPLALFLPLPFIDSPLLWGSSDALFYTNILAMVSDALKAGDFFPQWLADANAGFGSPAMLSYAPLAYFITALFNLPLVPLHLDIGTQFLIGIYASQVASGWVCFLWLRRNFNPPAAFIASLLFVLLPYKFIYIYLHINLAQLWALALLPLWMMAAEDMAKSRGRAVGAYALCMAGVYYMHPPTLIAFGAVPLGFVLWFGRTRWMRNYRLLLLAQALGAAVCLVKALPQWLYMKDMHTEGLFEGKLDWASNFNHIDVLLYGYYGLAAFMGASLLKNSGLRDRLPVRACGFWLAVMATALFLTQSVSAFIWRVVTPLHYLQFPAARLHACALMAATYLFCSWLAYYPQVLTHGRLVFHKAVVALVIAAFGAATFLHIHHAMAGGGDLTQDYVSAMRGAHILYPPEYKTRWNCIAPGRALDLYQTGKVPQPVVATSASMPVSQVVWQPPDHITFTVQAGADGTLIMLRQCYFPLWQASEAGTGERFVISPSGPDGIMAIALPRGDHTVEVSFAAPAHVVLYRWISLLALLACVAITCRRSAE